MTEQSLGIQKYASEAGYLLWCVARSTSALVDRGMSGHGLSYVEWLATKLVSELETATAGDLSRRLGMTSGAMTHLLDRLVAAGAIGRFRARNDRRVVHLVATDAGRRFVGELEREIVATWSAILIGYDAGELDRLTSSLRALSLAASSASTRLYGGVPGAPS